MSTATLDRYLSEHQVKYQRIEHPRAFTAQEVAAAAHIPSQKMAKCVMVKLDGRFAMVVLAANQRLDLDNLKHLAGAHTATLAPEHEFSSLFRDCEPGAMPPFGNLYGLDVYADADFNQDREIAFNAGSHEELVCMAFDDFARLVHPKFGDLSRH